MKKKRILKGIILLISILVFIINLGVLGKDEWFLTQIATIFYPAMYSWGFIISLLILLICIYEIAKEKWNMKSLSKISIIIFTMAAVSLIAIICEFIHYRNAIVKNGADINIFSGFEAGGESAEPDEKVVYAIKDDEELSISIYNPQIENTNELRPVYVYVHGGGWSSSDSESNANYHNFFKEKGYVSFSINYRLATDERPTWDKQIEDINDAMKWIYENAKDYGGDSERIFMAGESAGGNLALVYGGRVSEGSLDGPIPKALTVLYPAIDLEWTSKNAKFMTPFVLPGIVEKYIGGGLDEYPDRVKTVSPMTYINPQLPPVLIIHGQKDTMVTINGSREYIDEISKLGIQNQLAEIPYCNHGTSAKVNFDITMSFLKEIPDMTIDEKH